ncbi:MAG TPA: RES family NAD+ phosphorylase [Spirochaetia bacterium]
MTIKAFRLTKTSRASSAFTGEGARAYGGRWNSPGQRVVYTSSSLSLAVLEIMVHLGDYSTLLRSYTYIPVEIPSDLVSTCDPASLPTGWNDAAPSVASQLVGDSWIADQRSVVLAVPTVLVPDELNYLINPDHPDFHRISIGSAHELVVDPRLIKS